MIRTCLFLALLLCTLPCRPVHADPTSQPATPATQLAPPATQSLQAPPLKLKAARPKNLGLEVGRAETMGFYQGLGTAGLLGAPQLLAISYIPIRFGVHIIGESDGVHPYAMVLLLPVFGSGLVAAGLGVTELVVASRMLHKHRGPPTLHPLVRRAHQAGKLRGLGYGLGAHGVLMSLVAGPMLALPDELMGNLFGSPDTGKVILGIGLGLGLAQAVAGGVLALTGHSRMGQVLQRVTATPVALPGGGGLGVVARF